MRRQNDKVAGAPFINRLFVEPDLAVQAEMQPAHAAYSAGLSNDLQCVHLDDATAAYVLSTRNPFDLLRRSASQLAGLMVLRAAGAREAAAHPMLERALEAHSEANDSIRSIANNVPLRAEHHRRHVLNANRALAAALKAACPQPGGAQSMDSAIVPLRAAYRELQLASFALPGFEIVAFSQGCCAHMDGPDGDKGST